MSLAREIASFYGHGKEVKNGAGWLTFCCCHENVNTPALAVKDKGDGDVIVQCHGCGASFKEIKDKMRADGALPEWKPDSSKSKKNSPPTTYKKPVPEEEKESFVWKMASKEGLENAHQYFSNRGIAFDPWPVCLKWNSYKDKKSGDMVNMIVAAASKPSDKSVFAVQRLFIDTEDHTKTGAKMLGNCDGRGVWFDRKGDMTEIVAGEGIETVLSAMQATGKNGVATLSTAGMKNLIIPEETEVLYILVDSDPVREKAAASMPGQKAAYIMAEKFEASREGRKAFLVSPDDTCFTEKPTKQDFNDLLKEDLTGESIKERFNSATRFTDMEWQPPVREEEEEEDTLDNDIDAEQAMFERYVFLTSENKIIDTRGHDIKESMMIERAFTISQAGSFHRYEDEAGTLKVMPLTKHWLLSESKKTANSLRYSPGKGMIFKSEDGRTYYNTYRLPFHGEEPLPPSEQESRLNPWNMIMDTVFHEHKGYIEDWLAFTLQHPHKRAGIMPVCISGVGLGKSLIMAIISRVVGFQNFSNGKILDVTGLGRSGTQWGDWIYNKKISCIEEIDPEGESGISYKVLDALKDIITNETLSLNLKGGRNGTFPIYSNIIGFSNHANCVKIPYGDRRLFVVDSTGQDLMHPDNYKLLWDWINDRKNILAVYHHLMDREISNDFIPGQAQMTPAKRALQVDGRSKLQTAFDMVIDQYPSDVLTGNELKLAVSDAMQFNDEENTDYKGTNWNANKQYQAILKTTTTVVADGKRIRVQRINSGKSSSVLRAIRNNQYWSTASIQEIKDSMYIEIPWKWLSEEDETEVPF
jgi:hypothetical protein